MDKLGNNLDILEMENYIESQLINSKYDVENLNEEDYLQIAEDAVMEYLS